ncbi:MAG: hypothetical protein ACFFCS_13970 [Candidatus Hodarchaeota archaeon]
MLEEFKQQSPYQYVKEGGYRVNLEFDKEKIEIAELDLENEAANDAILRALQALAREGGTTTKVRYKGKRAKVWFRNIFPEALCPQFFGLFNPEGKMVGYINAYDSVIAKNRKVLGIAIVNGYRRIGLAFATFSYFSKNVELIFSEEIDELVLGTTINNLAMIKIAEKLNYSRFNPTPEDDSTVNDEMVYYVLKLK